MTNQLNDYSGTIAVADTSQQVAEACQRQYFFFANYSDTDMWCDFGDAAVSGSGFFLKAGGGFLEFSGSFVPSQAFHVICAVDGKDYVSKEG